MPYPRNIAEIIGRFPLMPLDAGPPDGSVGERLEPAMLERLFGGTLIHNATAARLCQAGLWLLSGHLDECHAVARPVGTAEASLWRAIAHRRGGDPANSVLSYRRAGPHPVHAGLLERARLAAGGDPALAALIRAAHWSPEEFVACCGRELARPTGSDACRRIQQAEWELLFHWCYTKATQDA
jgi:hypothetical protein